MCEQWVGGGEHWFVARMEQKHGRCDVCGRGRFFHDWRCEGHPRHEEWKESGMYRPAAAITRAKP